MIITHEKPAHWVDTSEGDLIQPSEVAGLVHVLTLEPGDLLQGDKGDKGDQGPQGDKGDKGDQGPQGVKGDTGAAGATGAQGVKGNAGAAGATGAQGVKGNTGATGAQGVKGDTGAAGAGGLGYVYTAESALNSASGAVVSVGHGLGVRPADAVLELVCVSAENGYSVGDAVDCCRAWSGGTDYSLVVWRNSEAVGFTLPDGFYVGLPSKSTGVNTSLSVAKWTYRFRLVP